MIKKQFENVQWMFIGSRATETPEIDLTMKIRNKMPRKERDLHSFYLSIEERAMPILLDDKKCQGMFSNLYGKSQNFYFHKTLATNKQAFKQKLQKFFKADAKASLLVYS